VLLAEIGFGKRVASPLQGEGRVRVSSEELARVFRVY
jgi:hypothetical protein